MVLLQAAAASRSPTGDPWYHDPDCTEDTANLLCKLNDERPWSDEYVRSRDWILQQSIDECPNVNGRLRRYISALENKWLQCYAAVEERSQTIEQLTTENEHLWAASGEVKADRA
ncbi:hypothetical protein BDD12DRAFT_883781 [Trichophaea hybrida]|nr:hypothetical protein BDD12DRAFT_883781 [Trichophaea hybrida]